MGIYGTHYFFYTNYGRTQTYYHYDLVGDELEILDIPKSDELYIMRDNIIAGTTSQNNAYFFDAKINSDTLFNLTPVSYTHLIPQHKWWLYRSEWSLSLWKVYPDRLISFLVLWSSYSQYIMMKG